MGRLNIIKNKIMSKRRIKRSVERRRMIKFNEIEIRRRERRIINRNQVAIFVISFPSAKTNNNNRIKRDGIMFFIFAAKLAANVTNERKFFVTMSFNLTHAIAKHFGNMRETFIGTIGLNNNIVTNNGVFSSLRLVLRTTLSIFNHIEIYYIKIIYFLKSIFIMENLGVDPSTSRTLSERSAI
jgi:hypothetical protein